MVRVIVVSIPLHKSRAEWEWPKRMDRPHCLRLQVDAEILFRGSEPLPVGRRAVALLRVLVERPGEPVSKAALIEAA